jgi:hypothetical protein
MKFTISITLLGATKALVAPGPVFPNSGFPKFA